MSLKTFLKNREGVKQLTIDLSNTVPLSTLHNHIRYNLTFPRFLTLIWKSGAVFFFNVFPTTDQK